MKKLLHELNIFDVVLCLFVIFIHTSSEAVGMYRADSLQFATIFFLWKFCSLAVPCFIFLAGFRFFYSIGQKSRRSFEYFTYIKVRLLRIYVPYFIWVIIYYAYFVSNDYFPFNASDLVLYILRGDLVAHFYFIVAVFQFYLLAPVWRKLFYRIRSPYAAIAVSFIIMTVLKSIGIHIGFEYNDFIFTTYLAYWTAGCFFGMYYESFAKKRHVKAIGVFVIIGLVHLTLSYLSVRGLFVYTLAEQVHAVFCLSGCFFMYYSCLTLYKRLIFSKNSIKIKGKAHERLPTLNNLTPLITLSKLCEATFYVYLSHILVIIYISDKLNQLGILSITIRLAARGAAGLLIPFAASMIYIRIKSRLKSLFLSQA